MGNLDGAMFATAGILLVLAVIACALRCYARIGIMKSFGADDWLMMLSLVSILVFLHDVLLLAVEEHNTTQHNTPHHTKAL